MTKTMTPKWEGHVYDYTGPIAAYERLREEKPGVYQFTCSHVLDQGRGFSVDGISLVSEGWITLAGSLKLVIAHKSL